MRNYMELAFVVTMALLPAYYNSETSKFQTQDSVTLMDAVIVREVGDISENKDDGIIKSILREAVNEDAEQPSKNDTVLVHYTGRLDDGTEFDSSDIRNKPFSFKLGKGEVIKGWDIGVATMKIGEKCRLQIKPEYGYGEAGSGEKIPPNATLWFDIELIGIVGEDVSEDRDGSVVKRIIRAGEGYEEPNDGALVYLEDIQINFILETGESFRKDQTAALNFVIGEAEEHGLPEGLECAIMRMRKNEKARIEISKNRLGGLENCDPSVHKVIYTLVMPSFDKAKESWQMNAEEKIAVANKQKEQGTKFFKDGSFQKAIRRYKKAVDLARIDSYGEEKESADQLNIFVNVNNNLCLCYNKTGQYQQCIECADKVVEKDPKNEKALFRRGEAKFANGDWAEALHDFAKVLEINGSNTAAVAKIREVKHKMREYREHEKNIFANMMKALGSSNDSSSTTKPNDVKPQCCKNTDCTKSHEDGENAEVKSCCGGGDCSSNRSEKKCKDEH